MASIGSGAAGGRRWRYRSRCPTAVCRRADRDGGVGEQLAGRDMVPQLSGVVVCLGHGTARQGSAEDGRQQSAPLRELPLRAPRPPRRGAAAGAASAGCRRQRQARCRRAGAADRAAAFRREATTPGLLSGDAAWSAGRPGRSQARPPRRREQRPRQAPRGVCGRVSDAVAPGGGVAGCSGRGGGAPCSSDARALHQLRRGGRIGRELLKNGSPGTPGAGRGAAVRRTPSR